jgi:hypothetical protein
MRMLAAKLSGRRKVYGIPDETIASSTPRCISAIGCREGTASTTVWDDSSTMCETPAAAQRKPSIPDGTA